METIFVDTNVIIDFLLERVPFFSSANKIFELSNRKKIILKTSSLSYANAYYILDKSKINSKQNLRKIFSSFRLLIDIIPVTGKIIDTSLADSTFTDFEDGIQHYAAISDNCDFLITRNVKHFKNSQLPIFSPSEYISKNDF